MNKDRNSEINYILFQLHNRFDFKIYRQLTLVETKPDIKFINNNVTHLLYH